MQPGSTIAPAVGAEASPTLRHAVGIYLELAKARLGALVVLTAVVGYVLAARGSSRLDLLVLATIGTALAAFGANIFNQVLEVDRDRLMARTRQRPLPSGRISRRGAFLFGLASCVVGVATLAIGANLLTAGIAVAIILLYTLVYTPMKVRSPANTLVGAVCGALPPVMGWTAATGRLEAGAAILFGVLFVWQIPHFLSLAWMYRDEYAGAGFRMLPVVDPQGVFTARTSLVYAVVLLPLTALVWIEGLSGTVFLIGSQLVGVVFVAASIPFVVSNHRRAARRLFLASILYLPILLGLMVADMDDRVRRGAFLGAEPSPPGVQQATASSPRAPDET